MIIGMRGLIFGMTRRGLIIGIMGLTIGIRGLILGMRGLIIGMRELIIAMRRPTIGITLCFRERQSRSRARARVLGCSKENVATDQRKCGYRSKKKKTSTKTGYRFED